MIIRKYQPSDCKELTELFYNTVHNVNARDYTKEQLNVWATGQVDLEKWNESLQEHFSVVAVDNEIIALDSLYGIMAVLLVLSLSFPNVLILITIIMVGLAVVSSFETPVVQASIPLIQAKTAGCCLLPCFHGQRGTGDKL